MLFLGAIKINKNKLKKITSSPLTALDQPDALRSGLSAPHLPRQLHRSLEYCAAAPHTSIAVIQSAQHGRSMVACAPTPRISRTATRTGGDPRRAQQLVVLLLLRTVQTPPRRWKKSPPAAPGYMSPPVRENAASEDGGGIVERAYRSGAVCVCVCLSLSVCVCAVRHVTEPGARANSGVDTRTLAPGHAHTFP